MSLDDELAVWIADEHLFNPVNHCLSCRWFCSVRKERVHAIQAQNDDIVCKRDVIPAALVEGS